ncbi:phage tail protein [Herbaspirillum sp. RV1423]|uniref:phage tail protein n=1 Tax=Herbaspirillum sp. RV1423 TaxID=1443993 RepID=UPI0004B79A14|nr:phage tail protein [Herbaspirillum sp. RV1423]
MGALFGGGSKGINTTGTMALGLQIQTSAYGLCVPIVYGTTRVPGNLIWYGDFTPIPHTTSSSAGGGGGKGGGGGGESTDTQYTYTAALMIALSEGPIAGVSGVYKDKSYYAVGQLFSYAVGSYAQAPWSYLSTYHPDQAISYPGIAYVASPSYDLGSNTSLPNHNLVLTGILPFNVGAGILDANPCDILIDYLTNPNYGAGFPASKIGDLTSYSQYCIASGLMLSPAYSTQQDASQTVTSLMQLTNSAIYLSEDVVKIVPYGDQTITGYGGVTFVPNLTPVYDLNDDHFIYHEGEDPIKVSRNTTADAFNRVQLEFLNRANSYNTESVEAKDQANIDTFGMRTMGTITAHEIADKNVAVQVAQLVMQRSLYIRNTYEFNLPWNFCLLEPTDLVTLTDTLLGLNKWPVRITSVEENDDGELTIQAEDAPPGVSSNVLYPTQAAAGYSANYNEKPSNTNSPIIFEAPDLLTVNGLEVWIAASGTKSWSGCQVWVSEDGNTYRQIGSVSNAARQGVLTDDLPLNTDPDVLYTLAVNLSQSNGVLTSGTKADADGFNTLCYVDGELISYQNAALTGPGKYGLSYLRRGVYGTTIKTHVAGTQFSRLDGSIFKYPFGPEKIGVTMFVKLPAVNQFGGGLQALSDVPAYQYTITGSALNSPLPNLSGLNTNFVSGLTQITWSAVSDFRQPSVDYEVRLGPTWASAQVLGRTPTTSFTAVGDGTYWISAHYLGPGSFNVYSNVPSSIIITGATLTKNVIQTFGESATGWAGTLSSSLAVLQGELILQGAGNILAESDVLTVSDVLWYGGISSSGEYDLPPAHSVNIGRVAPCNILMSYTARGQSIHDNALSISDFLGVTDLLGAELGASINIQPQIAIASNNGIYGAWQNFVPGTYNAQYFKARVLITSSDKQVIAVLSDLKFSVDVPDRLDAYQVTTATTATTVTFTSPFNGGPGTLTTPIVQATILNAQAGDDCQIGTTTKTSCTVQVTNGGSLVVRNVNLQIQGY